MSTDSKAFGVTAPVKLAPPAPTTPTTLSSEALDTALSLTKTACATSTFSAAFGEHAEPGPPGHGARNELISMLSRSFESCAVAGPGRATTGLGVLGPSPASTSQTGVP